MPDIGGLILSTSPNASSVPAVRDVDSLRRNGLAQVEQITSVLESEAYRLIFVELPQAITDLDTLYRTDPRCNLTSEAVLARGTIDQHLAAWRADPPEGVSEKDWLIKRNRTVVVQHSAVVDMMDAMKPHLLKLANVMNNISLWIKLRVPELETGDNFGVEVQAEILSALSAAENSYLSLLADFTTYHGDRADLIKDLMVYPGLEDLRLSLIQMDDRTYLRLQLAVADLRNEIVTIFDLLCKNMPKLKVPKTAPATSTYL